LVANSTEPGPNVWQDDCVELFLDPDRDRREPLQLVVNCIGVPQDNLGGGAKAAGEIWTAAAGREEGTWTVEMRVPWGRLGVGLPREGDLWGFNVARERRAQPELSEWSCTYANFHRADRYGDLVFGRGDLEVTHVEPGLAREAEGLAVTVRNRGPATQTVRAKLRASCEGQPVADETAEADVPANGEATLRVPYRVEHPGAYELSLELTAGDTRWYAGTFADVLYSAGLNSLIWPAEEQDHTLYVARETVQHFFFFRRQPLRRGAGDVRFRAVAAGGRRVPRRHGRDHGHLLPRAGGPAGSRHPRRRSLSARDDHREQGAKPGPAG